VTKMKMTIRKLVVVVAVSCSALFSGCSEKQKPAEQQIIALTATITNATQQIRDLDLKGLAKQAAIYGWWCGSERGMTLDEMLADLTNREAIAGMTNMSR